MQKDRGKNPDLNKELECQVADCAAKIVKARKKLLEEIEERKQVEKTLRQSKEEFRLVFENAKDAFFWANPETGLIINCNEAAEILLEKKREQIVGSHQITLHPPHKTAHYINVFKRHIEEKDIVDEEAEVITKSGKIKPVQISSSAILIGGKPIIQGIFHDITRHKKAEEALLYNKEELQTILDSVPSTIWYKDTENRLIRVNKAAADFLGVKRKDIEGKSVYELFPEEAERYYQEDLEVIRSGTPKRGIIEQLQAPSGQKRWVCTDKIPYYDQQGKITGIIVFAIDITESREIERMLKESEERFDLAVKGSNDGIWDWPDINVDKNWWSPRLYELLGYEEGEIEASFSKFEEMLHPDDREKTIQVVHAHLEKRLPYDMEFRLRTKSGEYHWFQSRGQALWDKEGNAVRMSGSIRDISDHKQAEKRLTTYRNSLRILASKLTLTEEHQRQKIAASLHDDVSQDLMLLMLKLNMLRKSASSNAFAESLDEISAQLEKTIHNTTSLTFDLSSPILYKYGFEPAVEEWLIEQIQGRHGIKTEFDNDGQPKPLEEDVSILLFRSVRELLINVVKHAQAHSVKVSICRKDGQTQTVVEDDGIGMDPSRISPVVRRDGGFGLFSIRERMDHLGGNLKVESEPGRGTRITLTAPLKLKEKTKGEKVNIKHHER